MKSLQLTLFFLLISNLFFSQIEKFRLIDQLNNIPIKYANIKSTKNDVGVSSDSVGVFSFEKKQTIYINAVGYGKVIVDLDKANSDIFLERNIGEIKEVLLKKRTHLNPVTIDKILSSNANMYYGLGVQNSSWIIGKLFISKDIKLKFLKEIKVITKNEVKNSKFNVRLYAVNSHNEPEDEIYSENIIGSAKKGRTMTTIDLSKINIKVPENGIFIALDWIKTADNLYEYSFVMKDEKEKRIAKGYSPSFGAKSSNDGNSTFIFRNNEWLVALKNPKDPAKYMVLEMELIVTD